MEEDLKTKEESKMNLIQEIVENNKVVIPENVYAGLMDGSRGYMFAFAKTIGDKLGEYPGEDEAQELKDTYAVDAENYIKTQDGFETFRANQLNALGSLTITALEAIADILKDEDKVYDLFHILLSSKDISVEVSNEDIIKMLKKLTYNAPSLEL